MDAKKLKEITTKIIENLGNQGMVSELLTELADDNTNLETNLNTYKTDIEGLKSDNESLRQANNKLFIRLGSEEKQAKGKKEEQQETEETEVEMPYENLFDEKGGLK